MATLWVASFVAVCDISRAMTLSEYLNLPQHAVLTQAEQAELVGVSRPYLIDLISGRRRPSWPTMEAIAARTGNDVPVSAWLAIGGSDAPEA